MTLLQSGAVPAIFGVVARATLLLVIGWCGALLLRRAPAGARHLVWLIVIAGVLLIPALSRVAPLHVAVLPSERAAVVAPGADAGQGVAPTAADAARPARESASDAATHGARFVAPSYGVIAVGVWLCIAGTLLGWLVVGMLTVRRIVRGARALNSPRWMSALSDAAHRLGLAAAPRLVASDRVEMAFACDALAPTIVLPAAAEEWSDERRRAVLLHELAHVRRRDLAGHAISRLACVVYWFHPLVWVAARRLRAESELACDDLVLTNGMRASDYAQHLLDMVTALGRRPGAPNAALPMARRKEFEGRLLAILDRQQPRGAPGRAQLASVAGVLGLLTMSVAAVVPVARTGPRALPAETVASLMRYGTTGVINPMLMILREGDSLRLTAAQADSIATLSRWYMVRVSAIWSPVSKYYKAHPADSGPSAAGDEYARAPEATTDLLIKLAPSVSALLTPEQHRKLSARTASYLDARYLAAIAAGSPGASGVFDPTGGRGSGSGARGRARSGGM